MSTNKLFNAGVALAIVLLSNSPLTWTQPGGRDDHRGSQSKPVHGKTPGPAHHQDRVFDRRHSHNRYYPRRGHLVNSLPHSYRVFPHRGVKYYFSGGVWYRPSGSRFSVVVPPAGLVISSLPPYYTTLWFGGFPYYYAAGVYYVWNPSRSGYVVTEAPSEAAAADAAEPDELFIYPMQDQSEQQQASDRYACHQWASGQTGFDPTKPGGNVPAAQNSTKRADYNRAMTACLEARGYSVK